MYIEFLLIISDYFKTINKKIIIYEWIIPLLISILCIVFGCYINLSFFKEFKGISMNILGVLLGLSIAVITIITTGSGKNLEEIKNIQTSLKIGTKNISLYDLLLINFSYTVVAEILLIIFCLLAPLISKIITLSHNIKLTLYSFMIFIVIHILLITLRNITNFYLIISKK